MWPKQSRKSLCETSRSPLLQPALKKISYAYSGSPDSPCIRRSVRCLSNSDDIKRNLRNITDDDYDQGYSAPMSQPNFPGVSSPAPVTTIVASSPCNSIDSGFQSPTGFQSPPSGSFSFSLTSSQLNSLSSPQLLSLKEESRSSEDKCSGLQVTPNTFVIVKSECSTPSPCSFSNQTNATKCPESAERSPLIFTTPVQDKTSHSSNVIHKVSSTSVEKSGQSYVKTIYLNSLELPSSYPSISVLDSATLQNTPLFGKNQMPPKDIVIEIFKSEECQTPKFLESFQNKAASCTQTVNNDEQLNKRPSQSYEQLIKAALNSSRDKKMTLKEIRRWIEDAYPFYKNSLNPAWKDAIRHNLSVSKLFVKESPKYGSYWKLAFNPKQPAISASASPQVPSGVKCRTKPSNSNSSLPAMHVFNAVDKFPIGNSNPKSRTNYPNVQQKVKLKKKGPLPILPRPSVDPQPYILLPLQYFCNSVQNNMSTIPELSSNQKALGSSLSVPGSRVIAQSTTSCRCPLPSTPISTSGVDITGKDLLAYKQTRSLSPLATTQISNPDWTGRTVTESPVLLTTVQPSHPPVLTPDHSKQQVRPTRVKNSATKSKLQESPFPERNIRTRKFPSDRKSRRKQQLVYKDLSLMDSSPSDIEVTSSLDNSQNLSPLPQTPTRTNLNTLLYSIKTPSPPGKDTQTLSPGQIFFTTGNTNVFLQTPSRSQKLMLEPFEMSPNSLEVDSNSLKDGNLSDFSSQDDNEFWELFLTNENENLNKKYF